MSTYNQKNQQVNKQFNINSGITLEEHEARLKKQEKEIREGLKPTVDEDQPTSQNLSELDIKILRTINVSNDRVADFRVIKHGVNPYGTQNQVHSDSDIRISIDFLKDIDFVKPYLDSPSLYTITPKGKQWLIRNRN